MSALKAPYLVFEVSGCEFGVPLSAVEEVVPAVSVTPTPQSPPFFLGLAAVRGRVMGVIDSAKRYRLGPSLSKYFLVCRVRGNLTAITIDRAIFAGELDVQRKSSLELEKLAGKMGIDLKFCKDSFSVLAKDEEGKLNGLIELDFLEIDPDLFVSAEMASRVGEADV
jgi:chemotaxis signal transduction protein